MFKAIYYTSVVPDSALLAVSGCATEEVEDAHHPAQVNGQNASQPNGTQRYGGDPVPSFNAPHIVLETPSHISLTLTATDDCIELLAKDESVLPWVGAHYMDVNTGEDISPAQYEIQQEQGPLHAGNLIASARPTTSGERP